MTAAPPGLERLRHSPLLDGPRYAARSARLLRRLPGLLRQPLAIEDCRRILQRRLDQREGDFLQLFHSAVCSNPASPYNALLRQAGCEEGDVAHMVQQDGLEGALAILFRAGVYLTTDEYKGRRPAVRGSARIHVTPGLLQNPLTAPDFLAQTGGSRGAATPVPLALACMRDRAVNMALALHARGGSDWRKAIWEMSGIGPLLWFSASGEPVARWFTKADLAAPDLPWTQAWKVRIETALLTWTGRRSGRRLPRREYVPLDAPLPIVRWMEETLAERAVPHLWTSTSAAVRVCREAERAGIALAGAQFTVTGEPVTAARLGVIENAGAVAVPDYGSADSGGSVSTGCLAPDAPDDMHLFSDLNAVIQAAGPTPPPSPPPGALLLTSIRPTSPFLFINLVMGDRAVLAERRCGCPLEALGWRMHLHGIRSFEKLTAGGVTFMDTDVIRVLEEVLPRRFGGGPADYQIVEDADGDGRPRLRLLVHPNVGPADSARMMDVFLDALAAGSDAERLMVNQLRQERFLEVERAAPVATSSGKVLHLWSGREPGGEQRHG
jgi:hypothetical protein